MDSQLQYEVFTDQDELAEQTNISSVFVPSMKFEVYFSVRKQTDFPVVQEMVLRFIRTAGNEVSEQVTCQFLDFSDQELRTVIKPLLDQGLLIRKNGKLCLTDAGVKLFIENDEVIPSISQAEARKGHFFVESHCSLPLSNKDNSRKFIGGKFSNIIPDCAPDQDQNRPDYPQQLKEQFNRHFPAFLKSSGDLESYRSDKLSLHKVDHCKILEDSVVLIDIVTSIKENGVTEIKVLPFDDLEPKTEGRAVLRQKLIDMVTVEDNASKSTEADLILLRQLFGTDFLEGIEHSGHISWNLLMRSYSGGRQPKLSSGASVIFGSGDTARNRALILRLISSEMSTNKYSKDTPLEVVWMRPHVVSWGRSMSVFETLAEIKSGMRELDVLESSISFVVAENRALDDTLKDQPEIKNYRSRDRFDGFDEAKYFRENVLPLNIEIILVGQGGGIVLSHSFHAPNAPLPIPVGVFFEEMDAVSDYFSSHVIGLLKAFPAKQKKRPRR
jgi:hypothetical protein